MRRRLAVGLASVCLLAACGGSSSSPKVLPSTAETAAPAETVAAQDVDADRALANNAVLKGSDLPLGWTAAPNEDSTDGPDLDQLMSDCMQVPSGFFSDDPGKVQADSPDFTSPDDTQVHNSITIEATASAIQEPFAIFTRPEMVGCLQQAMTAELDYTFSHDIDGSPPPSDVTIGKATVEKEDFPTIGDGTVAYRVTVPITAAGTDVNVYADFVLIAKGRAGISVDITSIGSPFPIETTQELAMAVAGRLTDV
jgi:hypothetical protein